MRVAKRMKRVMAVFLTVILIITCVNIPYKNSRASENIDLLAYITASGTTEAASSVGDNKPSTSVLFSLPETMNEKAELEAAGVKQLVMTFTVSDFTAYSGETAGAMAYFQDGTDWTWNAGTWANISTSGAITVTLDMTSLDWGNGTTVGNLGVQFANLQEGSAVTYNVTSAYFSTGSGTSTSVVDDDRTNDSGVSAAISVQGNASNDWSGFNVSMTNNTGSSICDWVIVMQVPSGSASSFKCWNATFVEDGDTIYLYPMSSGANAVLPTGAMSSDTPGFGFASMLVNTSDITISKVLYNVGSSSTKDYSFGKTDNTGSSGGSTGGGVNIPAGTLTDYDYEDIDYNYAKLLQYSLYFYDANMCGSDVGEKSLLDWRNDCHTFDSTTYTRSDGTTVNVNLNGGFHDAGDHVKFGLPEAYAAFVLGMSYDTDKAAYAAAKQTGHLETITTHFADYFVNCTVLNSAGTAVETFCCQVGQGGGSYDHGYWGAPENQTNSNRPIFFTSASAPSTDIVSLTAAALAMQYKNFGGDQYLETAKLLFQYARDNNKAVGTTGYDFYKSSAWEDDYCLAAWLLYSITNDSTYLTEYNKYANTDNAKKGYWPLGWDNVAPALAYYTGNTIILNNVMGITDGNSIYGGYRCVSDWGSARYNTSMQYTGLLYDKLAGTDSYRAWAEGQMKYLLGNNASKQCFVTGYNAYSSKYPHHRAASGYTGGDQGTTAQRYTLIGALVGGQKTDGSYTDSASDYICNEVAIDYNATLVAASASIYSKYMSDTTNQYADDTMYVDGFTSTDPVDPDEPTTPVAVVSVSLNKEELELDKGATETLTATISPSNATDKTVSWSSDAARVATVSTTGKVTAAGAGEATITVKTTDGSKTASCTVSVYDTYEAPEAPTLASKTSTSVTLTEIEGCQYSKDGETWQNEATFSGLTPNTEYTFYARKEASGYYKTSVASAGTKITTDKIAVTGVSLNESTLTLDKGDTSTLTATISPSNATDKTVTWSSSDTDVATVDGNGKVTAKGAGQATITVTTVSGNKTAECVVTVWVTPEAPATTPSVDTPASNSITLEYLEGYEYRIKGGTWQNSNVFSGLASDTEYTFEIRKKADEGNYQKAGEVVEVVARTLAEGEVYVPVSGVTLDKTSLSLNMESNQTATLSAVISPENATDQTVQYYSSDETVATVDNTGKVTAVGPGETVITVKTSLSGKEASCTVKVYQKYAAPSAPTLVSVTTNTVTLQSVAGCEYSKDGVTWQASNIFTGLQEGTTYTFFARRTASGYYTTSDKSSGINVTTKTTPAPEPDPTPTPAPEPAPTPTPVPVVNVSYRTHVQSFGWQTPVSNGIMSGTSGKAKRLEGIEISVNGNNKVGIQYTTHCQSYGWLPWSANGEMNGTEGEAKRLEAIKIQLTGSDADKYDVYYRVHAQSYGWLNWAKNGEPAGTAGYAKRLEGIQIVVVKKDESFNRNMGNIISGRSEAYISLSASALNPVIPGENATNVVYRTHVQTYGWQGWKYNGAMSGTQGQAKRLEGINIKLTNKQYSGGISYTTHVQTYGWQGDIKNPDTWKKDGQMAGTSGEAKRLEAICITLTGEMANHYDVYYRVHAQTYGWLDWAKNGEPAGTAGYAKRLEGIEIVLVEKGGPAPGSTKRPYVQK